MEKDTHARHKTKEQLTLEYATFRVETYDTSFSNPIILFDSLPTSTNETTIVVML